MNLAQIVPAIARACLEKIIGWIGARSLSAPSTSNKLVTQAECSSAPSNADGDKLVNQADCSPAATAANPVLTHSACTSAPSNADGDRLVNQADATTAATAANPVLSVGGLTARSVSAPGVAVGTRLLTEADRPLLADLVSHQTLTLSVLAADPAETEFAASAFEFDPSEFGGAALFGSADGGLILSQSAATTQTVGWRLKNRATGLVVAEGAPVEWATVDLKFSPMTAWTPANLAAGSQVLGLYLRRTAGNANSVRPMALRIRAKQA